MSFIPLLYTPGKNPADVLDFSMDFNNILSTGDSLVTAIVTATPSDDSLTISEPTITTGTAGNTSLVTVWIGGGNLLSYYISYEVTTSLGETIERSAILNVQNL